jgi:hypothetical protein
MQPTVYSFISPRRRDRHRYGTGMQASEEGCDESETRRINDENPAALPDETRLGNLIGNNLNASAQFAPCPAVTTAFIDRSWVIGKKTERLVCRPFCDYILKPMYYSYKIAFSRWLSSEHRYDLHLKKLLTSGHHYSRRATIGCSSF